MPENVSLAFLRACQTVNIANFRFHDLRHTTALWMRMNNADIHTVALILGHKDLRMAARYQHLSPAFLSDAVMLLDSAFCGEEMMWNAESLARLFELVIIESAMKALLFALELLIFLLQFPSLKLLTIYEDTHECHKISTHENATYPLAPCIDKEHASQNDHKANH